MIRVGRRKREPVQVGLVVALTKPVVPGRALERLGALLARLGIESVVSSLVDASSVGQPLLTRVRRWSRRFDRGRDPELDSFALGLRRLLRSHVPQLVVLATDALLERGDEDLVCLDRYALELSAVGGRPLAFLELVDEATEAAPRMAPRYRPSTDLIVLPLESRWWRERPGGVLRRLQRVRDAPGLFDFRVVRRMGQSKLDPRRMSSAVLAGFAGPVALELGRPWPTYLRHSLDSSDYPTEVRHGEPVPVRILGWASGVPPVRTVEARAGTSIVTAPVTVHRPDVVATQPGLIEEVCGFELVGDLGPFGPGAYAVVWSVPGTSLTETVGTFRVLPQLAVERVEALAPAAVPAESDLPVGVRGIVLATAPAAVRVAIDGHELEVRAAVAGRDRDGDRPDRIEFRAEAALSLPGEDHVVEVTCRDERGEEAILRRALRIERVPGPPVRWALRDVGAHDPRTGRTPLHCEGAVFDFAASESLEVRRDGRTLARAVTAPWSDAAGGRGLASFAFQGDVADLPPGDARLELVLVGAPGGDRALDAWTVAVAPLGFALEVSNLKCVEAGEGDVRLVAEGTVAPGHLLDSLLLYVDGELRARLGAEWLAPAGAFEGVAARFHRFRFDSVLALEPGGHRLQIHSRRGGEESVVWERGIVVEPAASRGEVRIRSADLDRRLRDSPSPVWSRLDLAGEVIGARAGDVVEMEISSRPAASETLGPGGEFALAARPAADAAVDARLRVLRNGEEIVRSPSFRIAPRALAVQPVDAARLEGVLSRLLPSPAAFDGIPPADLLGAIFEREPGAIGDFRRALATLDARTREARDRPGEVVADPPRAPERALEVLFVAWEPPCHLHGGGVAIRNLLRAVGERHRVTLVHTLAPGEEGLSEEVRPWVRDILPVRREWRAPNFDPGFGVPASHAWSFSPDYRRAIEGELATGRYDLFNGDFLRTALHVDASGMPSVGVAHEIESYAAVATAPTRFAGAEEAARWVAPFLRALWFEAVFAPTRCTEFATVTAPEAEFLARVLPGRRLFVSPIPIDTERLAAAAALRDPSPVPVFLFFGNFIHPPNRDAARLLTEEIAPAVRLRRPACRFLVAGANPPPELVERAGRDGVEVTGYVPDLGTITATATAFLAPIFEGAGMRVKLLEAMAAGCPVVSTPLGFSGIGGEAGATWLEARTVEEFVEAAVRLADDAELARRLGEEGRRFVDREFGIAAQGGRRERIWQASLAAATGSPPRGGV